MHWGAGGWNIKVPQFYQEPFNGSREELLHMLPITSLQLRTREIVRHGNGTLIGSSQLETPTIDSTVEGLDASLLQPSGILRCH